MKSIFAWTLLVTLVLSFFICLNTVSAQQNRVVVIPLIEDGITCSGTLVGTRWCDNGDQTVTDMTTGLVWLKHADWGGTMPWRSNTPGDLNDANSRAAILRNGDVVRTYNSIFFF